MIVNAQNISVLFQNYNAAFKDGFSNAINAAEYQQFAMVAPSSTSENTYAWLGQFPKLREWLGDRQLKNITAYGYSIRNKKFESAIHVPREAIEDDQYGVYTSMFSAEGQAAAVHPNELVYAALTAGLTTGLAYDGVSFFNTAHPMTDANGVTTTFSNVQLGAGNPWFLLDTTRMIKPLIFQKRTEYELQSMTKLDDEQVFMRDEFRFGVRGRCNVGYGLPQLAFASRQSLNQANFDAAYQGMMQLTDDQGRPLGIRPNLLVCGPTNRAAALVTIKAEIVPYPASVTTSGTTSVGGNTNYNKDIVDVLVTPYLV